MVHTNHGSLVDHCHWWSISLPPAGCEPLYYGAGCALRCNCGSRAMTCDNVLGCTDCRNGWTGEQCADDDNECDTNPCGDYSEVTIPSIECVSHRWLSPHPHHCIRSFQCVNTPGSYYCLCSAGFSLNATSLCQDIDECSQSNDCSNFAVCRNTPGNYTCECNAGYTGNGVICSGTALDKYKLMSLFDDLVMTLCWCLCVYVEDINECRGNVSVCHPTAVCENLPGLYNCRCRDGYFGNALAAGDGCRNENECESLAGGLLLFSTLEMIMKYNPM